MGKCIHENAIQIEANKETASKKAEVGAHTSIHPLAVCVIELRPGQVVPAFQTIGFHPDLHGPMHMDLFLLFTDRLRRLTRATPINPVFRTNHKNPT